MNSIVRIACLVCLFLACSESSKHRSVSDSITESKKPTIPSENVILAPDYNVEVLKAISEMPKGGGYSREAGAFTDLKQAIFVLGLLIHSKINRPFESFCSGATYVAFVRVLENLQKNGTRFLPQVLDLLLVKDQPDGTGIWGRWNSNGPGTARLFFELGMGKNFYDWSEAKPGDFMKIFWNGYIGKDERGHSVVFLGTVVRNGTEYVGTWSSNLSNPDGTSGMGEKWYPRKKIVRALFSRLEKLEAINLSPAIPNADSYLAEMLLRNSTEAEMNKKIGL